MQLYLLAGDFFNSDNANDDPQYRENMEMLQNFRNKGIKIDYTQNITLMKVPIVGSRVFFDEFIDSKMKELVKTLDVLVELPSPHVAHYLLTKAAGVCKVQWLMRTMPVDVLGRLFQEFDAKQRQVLQQLVGHELDEQQWIQAQLPIKLGGCGVRGAVAGADVACTMSRAMTLDSCKTLDRRYIKEGDTDEPIFCALGGAVRRVNVQLPVEKKIGDDMSCEISDIENKKS